MAAPIEQLGSSPRIIRSEHALWRRTVDGIVVLPPTGHVLHLDRTGALIWDLIAVPASLPDISATVALMCSAAPEEVDHGIGSLMTALREAGATEEVP